MRDLLFILLFSGSVALPGQVAFPQEFAYLLDSLDVRFNRPFDSDYRNLSSTENRYFPDQLSIASRDERLEMRFYLSPEDSTSRYYQMPHLAATTVAMNLGSNDEDAVTAVHSFGAEELEIYGADWARLYTFRPKRSFSNKEQAQLIALYRQGRGLAYTVLLFDEVPQTLEGRQYTLRFR